MGNEKEIREAIVAGERALRSLYEAREKLQKASDWGLFDMFGGNMFSGLMKHGRISEAKQCIEEANRNLRVFQKELRDVNVSLNLQIDIGVEIRAPWSIEMVVPDALKVGGQHGWLS